MKKMIHDFKEFALKGSVIDLAVGVIIGGGFGKIVTSLVSDIILPPFGVLLNGIDFKNLKWILRQDPDGTIAASINYGNFIQTLIEFFLISFSIFLIVRFISKLQKRFQQEQKAEEQRSPAPPAEEVVLLREIRDALKERKER